MDSGLFRYKTAYNGYLLGYTNYGTGYVGS